MVGKTEVKEVSVHCTSGADRRVGEGRGRKGRMGREGGIKIGVKE